MSISFKNEKTNHLLIYITQFGYRGPRKSKNDHFFFRKPTFLQNPDIYRNFESLRNFFTSFAVQIVGTDERTTYLTKKTKISQIQEISNFRRISREDFFET